MYGIVMDTITINWEIFIVSRSQNNKHKTHENCLHNGVACTT